MNEVGFEDKSKEVKSYLEAIEQCRKSTRQVTEAMENTVNLLAKTAGAYDRLVRYPGSSHDMINYYMDSSRRLNTFMLEDMVSFRLVWANNVVYQLDDLAYNARCATVAAKRRRDARERYLKSSQKSSNPFASAVNPERLKQKKDDYVLCSEQFDEMYKAFNGLRGQTVGVLQAHYFHDHSIMLKKLSEALKLRSTPPPPPPPLHARDGFNGDHLPSPSMSVDDQGSSSRLFPSGPQQTQSRPGASSSEEADGVEPDGEADEVPTTMTGNAGNEPTAEWERHHGRGYGHHRHTLPMRRSNYANEEAAFQEVGENDDPTSPTGTTANTTPTAGRGNRSASGSSGRSETPPPPANAETRLPPPRVETPVKQREEQQRRLSHSGSTHFGADGARSYPEAEAATAVNRGGADAAPVAGIPVLQEASPYQQFSYHTRATTTTTTATATSGSGGGGGVALLNPSNFLSALNGRVHNGMGSSRPPTAAMPPAGDGAASPPPEVARSSRNQRRQTATPLHAQQEAPPSLICLGNAFRRAVNPTAQRGSSNDKGRGGTSGKAAKGSSRKLRGAPGPKGENGGNGNSSSSSSAARRTNASGGGDVNTSASAPSHPSSSPLPPTRLPAATQPQPPRGKDGSRVAARAVYSRGSSTGSAVDREGGGLASVPQAQFAMYSALDILGDADSFSALPPNGGSADHHRNGQRGSVSSSANLDMSSYYPRSTFSPGGGSSSRMLMDSSPHGFYASLYENGSGGVNSAAPSAMASTRDTSHRRAAGNGNNNNGTTTTTNSSDVNGLRQDSTLSIGNDNYDLLF